MGFCYHGKYAKWITLSTGKISIPSTVFLTFDWDQLAPENFNCQHGKVAKFEMEWFVEN